MYGIHTVEEHMGNPVLVTGMSHITMKKLQIAENLADRSRRDSGGSRRLYPHSAGLNGH
jgi:hypothetical protein